MSPPVVPPARVVGAPAAPAAPSHAELLAFYGALERQRRWYAVVLWMSRLPRIPYDRDLWLRVHQCEQPETWHAGGRFGNGLESAGGGLGFSVDAYRMAVSAARARGVVLPPSAWDASPDQQMQAAQALLDETAGGPDCLRVV